MGLSEKQNGGDAVKLNLGSGGWPIEGFTNVDAAYFKGLNTSGGIHKFGDTIFPLGFKDGSAEEIRVSHSLEHLSFRETMNAIQDWVRVLKPGGVLKIAVPDFEWIARQYIREVDDDAERDPKLTMYLMGGQTDENDYHKAIFDARGLKHGMELAGLVDVQPWTSEVADCASLPVSLNLMGTKPAAAEFDNDAYMSDLTDGLERIEFGIPDPPKNVHRDITGEHPDHISHFMEKGEAKDEYLEIPTEQEGHVLFKPEEIGAMMSCPRLGFMDNMFSCYAIAATGIHLERSGGAFWDQGLTRLMQNAIAAGKKYLLTLDYDSVFVAQDVIELYRIMASPGAENIGALVAMQIRREKEGVLLTVAGEDGKNRNQILSTELEQPILPIRTGHFGLTMIRTEALLRMPKPWFMPVPDEKGEWGDNRRDSDVQFWCQWHDCGNTVFAAPRVVIGHTEQVVSWPDKNLKTFRQGMSDYQEHGKPKEAWK